MRSKKKKMFIKKRFTLSSDFEKKKKYDYTINQSIKILRNMKKVVIKN